MFLKRKIVLSALTAFVSYATAQATLFIAVSTPAWAQLTNSQGKTIVIPAGTTFEGRMDSTLSSKKSHSGDRFNVVLSSPVLANGTDVLIPAGAMVIGEVVEAIASNHQPHEKKQHVNGKLRVQITALRLPDGSTYPLIGSFIGESTGKGASRKTSPNLGSGVAYIGSQTNFNAVYPNASRQPGGNRNKGPQLVTKKQMMEDPLLGDPDKSSQNGPTATIRSLVKDHFELYIHEGAPMSVRLDAPLKMAIAPLGGMTPSAFSESEPGAPARPTFSRPRSSIAAPPTPAAEAQQQAQPQPQAVVAPPVPTGPSFLEPAPGAHVPVMTPQQGMQPQMQPQMQPSMQPSMQRSFGAPQGVPQSLPASAPAAGGWFKPPTTPAEQAAAAQATPYFNAAPQAFQAAPATVPVQSFAQPLAPPAAQAPAAASGFNAFQPAAQAAPVQSLGGFGAMPQQATAAPALAAPAAAALSGPPAAQVTSGLPMSAPAMTAAPAQSALPSLPPVIVPQAAPSGQSLDSFINSLGGAPASGATSTHAAAPAPAAVAPATSTPAAVPAQKAP
jgi:hypothetical protein